ncbi:MAG: SBBP repeat-containing protein, partial [Candidatus Heimdallarchaeaceae archaeon]
VANDVVLDNDGNAYIVGYTSSVGFPTSATAYNDTFSGPGEDVIVMKISADGSTLLYSTFIGGNGTDLGYDIEVDSSGCAYISGCTDSYNFPTVNAYDDTYNGKFGDYGDCFILKLSSDGSSILYSTFFGGSGDDLVRGMAIDANNNMIFTGETFSPDFPLNNAFDDEFNGFVECFYAKIAANGTTLVFSSFLGETEEAQTEYGCDIAFGNDGSIYFLGTARTNNITMTDDTTFGPHSGETDMTLIKLSADGSLLYSTYIGGDGWDHGRAIDIDSANNLYILGDTFSLNVPLINAYDDVYNYMCDLYLMKLNMTDSTPEILFSTYLGGEYYDYAEDLCIDSEGNVYVTGETYSVNYPVTGNALDSELSGSTDSFLSVLSSDGSELLYSTYIGGNSSDRAFSICVKNNSEIVLAGKTKSDDFSTEAAYDDTYSGSTDIFVLKIAIEFEVESASWSFYWAITTIFVTSTALVLISKRKKKKT